jgi:AcrR family transcriptional regulator
MAGKRGGRRQDPAVDAAIRSAVNELIFDRGVEMTYDEVAARAGVGRATVFRRYPTKRDLVLDAITHVTLERMELPDTGSVQGDFRRAVAEIMRVFGEPRMRQLTRQGLGESCRDEAFRSVLREVLDRRLEMITRLLGRGVERGELPATTDTRTIADLVSGVIAIRVAVGDPLPGEAEAESLADGLLRGFVPSA